MLAHKIFTNCRILHTYIFYIHLSSTRSSNEGQPQTHNYSDPLKLDFKKPTLEGNDKVKLLLNIVCKFLGLKGNEQTRLQTD